MWKGLIIIIYFSIVIQVSMQVSQMEENLQRNLILIMGTIAKTINDYNRMKELLRELLILSVAK